MTDHADECHATTARDALRAYLAGADKSTRRQIARHHACPHATPQYAVPLTGADGVIMYSPWQLHAIAGDLLS